MVLNAAEQCGPVESSFEDRRGFPRGRGDGGTGGSPGVDYLDETARKYRIFGELLQARNFLLAKDRLPELPHPDLLRFKFA